MRYLVQSPDERCCTWHRKLSGVARRVNWLLNRGHSDIHAEEFDAHVPLLLNEFVSETDLLIKFDAERHRRGMRGLI